MNNTIALQIQSQIYLIYGKTILVWAENVPVVLILDYNTKQLLKIIEVQ